MTRFIGRREQLAQLEQHYKFVQRTGSGRLLTIRGRRRIGKSRLVTEFISKIDAPAVSFYASRHPIERELALFVEAIAKSNTSAAKVVQSGTTPQSWEAALTLIASEANPKKPTVLVIDEFPYLSESDRTIEAILQKAWDLQLQNAPVLTILIGSDLATMVAMSQYDRPLYGRAKEMVVPPLNIYEVAQLLQLEPADAFDAYLVIGGFPELAASWEPEQTFMEYLKANLENSKSDLVVNAERSIRAEFPSDAHALAVLGEIGASARTFKRITNRTGLSSSTLERALSILNNKNIVKRELPYCAKRQTNAPLWRVNDPYLSFWLRFIGPNIESIDLGRGQFVFDEVQTQWQTYRGRVIEPLIRASIEQLLPDDRFNKAMFVGSYWTRTGSVEVDLVGGDKPSQPTKIAFVGSIKWRDDGKLTDEDINALALASAKVPGVDATTLKVGVARNSFQTKKLDVTLSASDLLTAWKR